MFWVILSFCIAAVISYGLFKCYSQQSTASTVLKDSDLDLSNRSVFKNFYTTLVRKKSASLTHLPSLLQRRHSTVGSVTTQMKRAAKNLFRKNNEMYRRQMSVGGNRDPLPKPPSEFFEPLALPEIPDRSKPLTFVHQNTKILELPTTINEEDIQVFIIEPNETIVKPGDPDDSIYVVLEGCLSVHVTPPDGKGKTSVVRRIGPGDSFFSSLSMLDIFMERTSMLKTVSLKAKTRTRLAKYMITNFYDAYKRDPNPAAWVRPVQILVTRLLHVVLTTLHQHMGLGEELINKRLAVEERHRESRFRGNSFKSANRYKPKLKRMSTEVEQSNMEQKMSTALSYFREALKISEQEAEEILRPYVKLVHLEENQTLFEEGNTESPAALGMVIIGFLKITQESHFSDNEVEEESWSAFIQTRELIGGLQVLTDEPAFYTIKGASSSVVALIEKADVERLIERKPSVIFPIAYSVLRRLSSFVRAIDFALGWVLLDSGEAVYRQGDFSDSVFVVLSGRLRSVTEKMAIEEFGKGDVLGIIDVLQRNPRTTTVLAVRYSQLARVPEGLLNFVKMQFPQVGFRLVRLLGQYYSGRINSPLSHSTPDPLTQRNLHTIAIFPATLDVPLVAFICELYHALSATTRVLRLSSKSVVERLGEEAVLERHADFRLMHWLNSQEDTFQLVIYECDYTATNWTRRCLSQADAILVVACGDQKPPEKHFIDTHLKMNQEGIRSRKELVLLWKGEVDCPRGTFEWLKGTWFSGHHHIHAPDRMFAWESRIDKNEDEVLEFYENHVFPYGVDIYGDFARLGRIISGNAVGLVLGGGGARGAAHIGVIRALREHSIPVDMVGGTSIGSLISGVLAAEPYDQNKVAAKTRSWFLGMCSFWKILRDFTYGYVARFTGVNFNILLRDLFEEKYIEDLWLPYFCITTDITNSEMRVHRNGPLWRYVRASMSLAVYLPPMCDSADGHYLLDGGYVNNLPADVMRSLGARTVIAVDVSSADEKDFHNYGDSISGVWAQISAVNPWSNELRIPTGQEIQDRLAFVSSVRQLELVKKAPYCNYLRPPIDTYKTMDFAKFDIIQESGYEYATDNVSSLIKGNNHLKTLVYHEKLHSRLRSASVYRPDSRANLHNSFADLAAQLSRIPPKYIHSLDDLNKIMDEEDEEAVEHEDEEMSELESTDTHAIADPSPEKHDDIPQTSRTRVSIAPINED